MNTSQSLSGVLTPKGWHSRGYIPHFDDGEIPQFVTFRLINSFPSSCMLEWDEELSKIPASLAEYERRRNIEEYLDKGFGETWLADANIAEVVTQAMLHFDSKRYLLHAWVVMPNHVHVLVTPSPAENLAGIIHSWKSFTSNKANALLGRKGPFWQREYFDRVVRNERHFENAITYIENNPVKANLCKSPKDWMHSSALWR